MKLRALALVPLLLLPAALASAEPGDKAAADALFRSAREEFDRGAIASACEKFAESNRLDPAPGTVLNLALCLEKLGRVASAWEGYRQVAEQLRDERVAFATQRSQALEPRLPWLTIRLAPDAPEHARVFRDGVELQGPSLGAALPLDPGAHTIVVRLDGHRDNVTGLTLAEGERRDLVVTAGAVLPAPRPAAPRRPPRAAPAAAPVPSASASPWPWIAGGVGVAGLATSLVTGGLALSRKTVVEGHCVDHQCDETGVSAARQGRTLAATSTIAGAVGFVGVGVGTYLLWDQQREGSVAARVDVTWTPKLASVVVSRRF